MAGPSPPARRRSVRSTAAGGGAAPTTSLDKAFSERTCALPLMVANPPYLPLGAINLLPKNSYKPMHRRLIRARYSSAVNDARSRRGIPPPVGGCDDFSKARYFGRLRVINRRWPNL